MFPILPGFRANRNHNHTTRQPNLNTFLRHLKQNGAVEEWHGRLLRITYLDGAPCPSGAVAPYAVALLCPLMHLFMQRAAEAAPRELRKIETPLPVCSEALALGWELG